MYLTQTKELQDLARLRSHLVNTFDTNDKGEFWLLRDVKATSGASNTLQADSLAFFLTIFLNVLLSTFKNDAALVTIGLLLLSLESSLSGKSLFDGLAFLKNGLRNSS